MSSIEECLQSSSRVIENLSGQVCLISSSKGGGSNFTPFQAAIFLSSLRQPSKSPWSYFSFGDSGRQAKVLRENKVIPSAMII